VTPLPDGVLLRPATLDDAPAAARMHLECWREAYSPYVDAELLEARLSNPDPWEETWRGHVEHGPPRTLALFGDEPIGFATAGPNRDADAPERELYALYLRESWWGSGVGQALLDDVLDDRACTLWVLEDNSRAIAFYERNGFVATGEREFFTWLDAWEIRMDRPESTPLAKKNDRTILGA